MSKEMYFYDQLFENLNFFHNQSNNKELWKINQINLLMNTFNDKNSSQTIQNGLVVIMAFYDEYLKDNFHSNNKDLKNLNDLEKRIVISILKEEFIS